MPINPWTDAELATLLQMRSEGQSARAIGEKVGRTRNSVLGRLHRMGHCTRAPQRVDRWPSARTAMLKILLDEGRGLTDIASKLGISRGAVRGKVRRNKLTWQQERPAPRQARPPRKPLMNEPPSLRLTIYDLKSTTCRWPQGERGNLHYCGNDAPLERAYCDYHHALAHCAGTVSERRASDYKDKRIAA